MTMKLIFESKDPLLARYYDMAFREEFEAQLATKKTAAGREQCQRVWRRTMLAEAKHQEHYDYELVPGAHPGTQVRKVIEKDGKPVLLIPEVRIEND